MRILDISQVVDRTGLSERTVYDEMGRKAFPRPLQLTARRVGWLETEIDNWIADKVAQRDGVQA